MFFGSWAATAVSVAVLLLGAHSITGCDCENENSAPVGTLTGAGSALEPEGSQGAAPHPQADQQAAQRDGTLEPRPITSDPSRTDGPYGGIALPHGLNGLTDLAGPAIHINLGLHGIELNNELLTGFHAGQWPDGSPVHAILSELERRVRVSMPEARERAGATADAPVSLYIAADRDLSCARVYEVLQAIDPILGVEARLLQLQPNDSLAAVELLPAGFNRQGTVDSVFIDAGADSLTMLRGDSEPTVVERIATGSSATSVDWSLYQGQLESLSESARTIHLQVSGDLPVSLAVRLADASTLRLTDGVEASRETFWSQLATHSEPRDTPVEIKLVPGSPRPVRLDPVLPHVPQMQGQ